MVLRVILGVLLGLNLIAAGFVLFPPGGSAEQMEEQLASCNRRSPAGSKAIEVTRQHVAAVEKGRSQGDQFLGTYFLSRRTAYSTLLGQLGDAAQQSQIKPREISYATEPIEGSDTLSMMTITASYEGTYQNLMSFVHQVDQSPGLMIIESLNAAPQAGSNTLERHLEARHICAGGRGRMKLVPAKTCAHQGRRRSQEGRDSGRAWRCHGGGMVHEPLVRRLRMLRPRPRRRFGPTRQDRERFRRNFPRGRAWLHAGPRGNPSIADFRPTLKLKEGTDVSKIDPSLHLDLLAKVKTVELTGGSRSLFEFAPPPAPPPPDVPKIHPKVGPVPLSAQAAGNRCREAPAPPPPPIPLKFYGFSGTPRSSGPRSAFFLDGDDIVIAQREPTPSAIATRL